MKCAIIHGSVHHGNTKKIMDAIAAQCDVKLIDATKVRAADLSEYDLIGFASGIYYSKFHQSVLNFANVNLPQNKDVFFIYTCGAVRANYLDSIKNAIKDKNANVKGEYHCLGFDTFGPFKLVGGIAKGHPNQEDINKAVEFVSGLLLLNS